MKRGRNSGSEEGGRDAVRDSDDDRRPRRTPTAASGDVFAAVRDLDAQDSREEAKRRRLGHRLADQSRVAQSQAALYLSLVECRIVLQRSLVGIQKWRQQHPHQVPREAKDESRPAGTKNHHSEEIVKHCDELLTLLLEGRRSLSRKKARAGDGRGQDHGNDDDNDGADVDYASVLLRASSRGGADEADETPRLETVLQSEYDELRDSWREILNRRHKDAKLRSGQTTSKTQFKVVDSTFWQQVEATAEHEHQHHQLRLNASASASSANQALDDSKVYQQLLKDFLASHHGASASSDAAQDRLRRRGAQQQQQRSSAAASTSHKAPVDRRASKGRKIRYHDLPKLQHFAFPVSRGVGGTNPSATTLLDEDEWFRSLFGGVGRNAKG